MNENEIEELVCQVQETLTLTDTTLKEHVEYLKLSQLPFELQIVKENREETFNNLYVWFKMQDDKVCMEKKIPEPYFSMYINGLVEEFCEPTKEN